MDNGLLVTGSVRKDEHHQTTIRSRTRAAGIYVRPTFFYEG